jgi:outer membrane lipoprotein carrier protein
MLNIKRISLLLCVVISVIAITDYSYAKKDKIPDGKRLLKNVQNAYKDLDNFSCNFRLEFTWALANELDVAEGTIDLAKKDKFRYETSSSLMITDGKTLWRLNRQSQQAIIENLKDAEAGILPREMLFDYPKQFDVGEVIETNMNGRVTYQLKLVPKKDGTGVKEVTVFVDALDSITRLMEFTDDSGNHTKYILSNIKINSGLDEARFTFEVPDGIKVFDLR